MSRKPGPETRPEGGPPGRATRAIHAGGGPRDPGDPVAAPIVQSSTFRSGPPGEEGPVLYTRYGNNPNQERVGRIMAALEGAEDALPLASGMAAVALSLLSLTRDGDHLVASRHLYGATHLLFETELPRRGVPVTLVEPGDGGAWSRAIRPGTRALYVELPTNPSLRVPDLPAVVDAGRAAGIPVVVDATFASPVNLRPLEYGAELVIHSGTKYLGGHSDLVAGVVSGSAERIGPIRDLLRLYGPALDPHAAWLLERGLRTLPLRVERQNRTAEGLARWFEGRSAVERVVYPGHPSHPDHEIASRLLDGFGGMLGVVLRGGGGAADRLERALRLVVSAPSLGGVETLLSQPRWTSHRELTREEREAQGIPDGFLRISVGLEDPADLEADFALGLEAAG